MEKRAQIQALTPAILVLVVSIIFLVVGLVIIQEIRDTNTVSAASSDTIENETLTTVGDTGEDFTIVDSPAATCTVLIVTNASDGELIEEGNYTATNCNLVPTGEAAFNGSDWNVSYTYTSGGEAFISGNSSIIALGDFSDFIPLIVIAIAASIVIGLILGGFALRNKAR